jgi:hypothetical protein
MNPFHFPNRTAARGRALATRLVVGLALCCAVVPLGAYEHHHTLTISGSPAGTVTAGQTYSFTPTASGSRYRTLIFAIANKPAWAAFSASSGQLSGTPSAANVGNYASIVIAVSDGTRTATLPAFALQVNAAAAPPAPPPPPPSPPVISGTPSTSVVAGSSYSFQPSASDPSGLTLAFSVQNKPAWAAFSIASGQLSGTPSSAQTGTYASVIISASDGQQSSALPAFSITVTAAPAATGTAVLDLTAPTQNTDGSALTNLAGFRIYSGTSPSSLTQLVQLSGATLTSYTINNLASGTWYFGATAYTTTGTESALSAIASKTVP